MSPDRTWHEDAPLERVHRIDFHVVMLFDDGPVTHMVDFAEYEATAGDLLWIRPGQVHRFSRTTEYRGTVLAMQPGFLPRTTVEATGLYHYDLPPLLRPDAAQLAGLRAALAQLGREYEDTATLPIGLHTSVLRHSLTAFLLRLSHLADEFGSGGGRPDRHHVHPLQGRGGEGLRHQPQRQRVRRRPRLLPSHPRARGARRDR